MKAFCASFSGLDPTMGNRCFLSACGRPAFLAAVGYPIRRIDHDGSLNAKQIEQPKELL